MRQTMQLITSTATLPATTLPMLATPNDVRSLVNYLKKIPSGVTLDEAADAVKRQSFEAQKLAAYEAMGLTLQESGRLKLAPLGWEMARQLEPEVAAFRALLDHLEPYRAALKWVHQQRIERLLQQDVANYWDEHFPSALGLSDEHTLESYVLCFFQFCQAAALGTHINGRKGQPSRLRVDGEELREYLAERPTPIKTRPELTLAPAPTSQKQVFISFQGQSGLAAQIAEALGLADLAGCPAERGLNSGEFLPAATLRVMRQCVACVFLLAACDFTNDGELLAETQIALGAALALYDKRGLLLHEQGLGPPATLRQLAVCAYTDNTLTWASGACLVKAMKEFVAA